VLFNILKNVLCIALFTYTIRREFKEMRLNDLLKFGEMRENKITGES